jgi:hypothetical protein
MYAFNVDSVEEMSVCEPFLPAFILTYFCYLYTS